MIEVSFELQATDETGNLVTEQQLLWRDNFVLMLVGAEPPSRGALSRLVDVITGVGA